MAKASDNKKDESFPISVRFFVTLLTALVLFGATALAVFLAKGNIFMPQQGEIKVVGTGMIYASSVPEGASVYIDGHLVNATNATIQQLEPKSYKLRIVKEGYTPWEKDVEVKEGLVSEVKATLFPALPTLYPLTYNGVVNPVLSPDGQKLAFAVPLVNDLHTRQKGGLWVWTMSSQPISFARGAEPRQVAVSTQGFDYSKATFRWSPDSKQLLVTLQENDQLEQSYTRNFLIQADRLNALGDLKDITPQISQTLKDWEGEQKNKDEVRLVAVANQAVKKVATTSALVKWSPDETKFIAGDIKEATPTAKVKVVTQNQENTKAKEVLLSNVKVYDVATNKEYALPPAYYYHWLPDSKHVILVQDNKVAIAEYDGSNAAVIYPGSFNKQLVFPWPDSSRIVIVTSFDTSVTQPNLFGINLK